MKALLQKINENRKLRLACICIPLAVMFFACAGFVVSQSADISRLKKQEAAYTQQLVQQQAENEKLEAILDSDNKDEYIEQKAREKGYVKSDEIVFYDVSGSSN